MIRESLARKFKPAGFEQPEGSRQNYVKPRPELQDTFYRWIEELPHSSDLFRHRSGLYKTAKNYIKDFDRIDSKEANSLLVGFKPKTENQGFAGLFVSACYSKSAEDAIVFDINAEDISFIGYLCFKPLINEGVVGDYFGFDSRIIINNGIAKNNCGEHSRTAINNGLAGIGFGRAAIYMVINNGGADHNFAMESLNFIISVNEPKGYGRDPHTPFVLHPEDCEKIPELKMYLDDLKAQTSGSPESVQSFFRNYGVLPHREIEDEIKQILIGGGLEIWYDH